MIPASQNAVSLENRRGRWTSLRGRSAARSGLKLLLSLCFADKSLAPAGLLNDFFTVYKERVYEAGMADRSAKEILARFPRPGMLYSYHCATNGRLRREIALPVRAIDWTYTWHHQIKALHKISHTWMCLAKIDKDRLLTGYNTGVTSTIL